MFRVHAEDRRYDLHRPRGCTLLAIEVDWWPGNEFDLWLPETLYAGKKIVWCNWEGDPHQAWTEADGTWRWEHRREAFSLTAELTPDARAACIRYRYTLRNETRRALRGLNTRTCFHLVNAPEFISIHGERIWACVDGAWQTTDRLPRHLSPDPRRILLARSGLYPGRRVVASRSFPSARLAEEAHHPLLIAERFGARGSVGIACSDFHHLFNNNDSILRCLHSEPMPLDSLAPEESRVQEGVILFSRGDHRALIRQFEKLVPAIKAGRR